MRQQRRTSSVHVEMSPFMSTMLQAMDGGKVCSQARGLQVVLVDDDEDTLALLSHRLEAIGLEVSPVEDGRGCLELYDQLKDRDVEPEVIILDLTLPRLSGADVAKVLRLRGFEGKLIAITGSKEQLLKEFRQGSFDFTFHKSDFLREFPKCLGRIV